MYLKKLAEKPIYFLFDIIVKSNILSNTNGKVVRIMITTTKDVNLRLAAQRRGFILVKRRGKKYAPGLGDGYMILDSYSGNIVDGYRYELSPEDVRDFLNEH